MDRPYMKGLSKPEKLVRVEEEDKPELEEAEDTIYMVAWCTKHREYETEECDGH